MLVKEKKRIDWLKRRDEKREEKRREDVVGSYFLLLFAPFWHVARYVCAKIFDRMHMRPICAV